MDLEHRSARRLRESFEWNRPVSELLAERLPLTIALAAGTLLFTWAVALPVGVYSAVRQYSIGDYVVTFLGFLGIAYRTSCWRW